LERAERQGLPVIGVQHHHAHIAACMAENRLDDGRPVIGVAFDGTGYGTDGAIWGGEFLVADYAGFQRAAHLAYIPLPGGDAATRAPWRTALAWLYQCGIDWADDLWPVQYAAGSAQHGIDHLAALRHQLTTRLNAPLTSSMGRLFDAAASLVGVRQMVNYEAQAAIEYEALADLDEKSAYPFAIDRREADQANQTAAYPIPCTLGINPEPLFSELLADVRRATPASVISARFHNGVAEMVKNVAVAIRSTTGITEIALSGGVWQNSTLFKNAIKLLQLEQFTVYTHRYTPPNDGGVALGQAVIASYLIKANR
jgi:hydrogenase maturation protein HypF